MPIELPTSAAPIQEVDPSCLIIYGPPKVGKTTITSILPKHLLLDLEGGSKYVSATKLVLSTIEELQETATKVREAGFPYKFVICDTLDSLEEWAEKGATAAYKNSIQGKNFKEDSVLSLPNGGGYMWLRNVFYRYFQIVRTMAPYTIFVGHIRDKYLVEAGKDVMARDLDLTGKIRNIVCAYADAIGHVNRNQKGELSISFKTVETVTCGSRCKHLAGKEFMFNDPCTLENWKQIYTTL